MTDMKKLMNESGPNKAGQRLSVESLAEAAKREPIYLLPVVDCSAITGLQSIRAASTRRLLAFRSKQGILFFDTLSQLQHILTVPQLQDIITSSTEESQTL